jgi:hypothetical protein
MLSLWGFNDRLQAQIKGGIHEHMALGNSGWLQNPAPVDRWFIPVPLFI